MKVSHKQIDLSGFLPDPASDALPSGACSGGYNMTPTIKGWEKSDGFRESAILPTNEKKYIMYWSPTRGDNRWFVCGNTTIEMAEGNKVTDVSRVGGYSVEGADTWQGIDFNGVPILNNSVDTPQYFDSTLQFLDLPNIPVGLRFRVLCRFKNYLVGLAPDLGQGFLDDEIYWSHPADAGTVPPNWDYADPASDSGRVPLPSAGYLVTGLELGDLNIIYKSDSIWTMQFIGGQFIFKFLNKFPGQGILNKNCVIDFEGKHFVVTQSDFIVHDGYKIYPVAENKVRDFFYEDLNNTFFQKAFVIKNPRNSQIMVFYPSVDSELGYCDKCLVMDWRTNTWEIRKVPNIVDAEYGYELLGTDVTWETYATSWQRRGTWHTPEDLRQYSPTIHYSSVDYSKLLTPSSLGLVVDVPMESVWERENIIVGRVSRDGVPYQNYNERKAISQLEFDVSTSGNFEVWIGVKEHLNEEATWEYLGDVNPNEDKRFHMLETGVFFNLRLVSTEPYFTLRGLTITYEFAGDAW